MRRVGIVLLMVLGVGLVPLSEAVAQTDGSNAPRDLEAAFVADTNRIRAEHGLARLPVEPNLVAKARDWSATMAAAGEIWHSDLRDGITIEWKRLGENVGKGGSVEALQAAFVDSPSHYQNIVDLEWDAIGIGVTVDEQGTIYVAVEFVEYPTGTSTGDAPAESPETTFPPAAAGSPDPAPAPPPATEPEPAESSASPTGAEPSAHLDLVLRHLRLLDG